MATAPDTTAAPVATPAAARPRLLSGGKFVIGLVATSVMLLGGGLALFLSQPETPQPADLFAQMLEKLEERQWLAARDLAKSLEEQHYRPDDFGGGVEYVLGMVAFRLTETDPHSDLAPQYAVAASYLREAERQALPAKYRPEWAYACGKSLFQSLAVAAARPLLEEAVETNPARRVDAAKLLAELYLDPSWKSPELLAKALTLNAEVLKASEQNATAKDAALLQKAEILLSLNRAVEAEAVMSEISDLQAQNQVGRLLKARILLKEQRYPEALEILVALTGDDLLDQQVPRQALYLAGWAAEQHSERSDTNESEKSESHQRAEDFYQKTIVRFERSDEGLVAELSLARLQQQDGAHEKALRSFGAVLRTVRKPEEFRNRWLSIEQFRQRILAAWTNWSESGRFAEAIALSEMLTPLFPRDQAMELAARAHQRSAESLTAELAEASMTQRSQREEERRRRWRESGIAYAKLAELRRDKDDFAEALWSSAEHARLGYDFPRALRQYDQYRLEATEAMRPVATVRRAEVLIDLDRYEEAAVELASVVKNSPTNPAAYLAQLLVGQCALEDGRVEDAEAAWRAMLASDRLSPTASEWRDASYRLGRLLTDTAGQLKRQADRLRGPEAVTMWTKVEVRTGEAVRRWEEFLARNPQSEQLPEARYYLGKSLLLRAAALHRQWELAETDNARAQTKAVRDRTWVRALEQFQLVRDQLAPQAQLDRLSEVETRILQNAWFEIPQTQFLLGHYQEAIAGFSAAASRHPQDVRVLAAYVQMAQAYAQLGKAVEARSMLEQAKVILDQQQIPATAFLAPTTNLSRSEWETWLDRVRDLQD